MISALVGALLGAAPAFTTDGSLEPQQAVAAEARAAWEALEATFGAAPHSRPILIRRGAALGPHQGGLSRPGAIELRQNVPWNFEAAERLALRHELAHQYLWAACPAAEQDRLFHEAFATATSGELSSWSEGAYLSLPKAAATLQAARNLDVPAARRALARVIVERTSPGEKLPAALTRRLQRCPSGAPWGPQLSVAELASVFEGGGDALVVLSRHSGEVLEQEGEALRPMPFGSVLKPLVVAGAPGAAPKLRPRVGDAEWLCGKALPSALEVSEALLRSCNGYFLDWALQDPALAGLGGYGPALVELGLGRAPKDITEAIGLRSSLTLSPWGVAQAYRLLADARPDLVTVLTQNAARGTLSELGLERALRGVAAKTGTVRDAQGRPALGWIAAVTDDHVVVMVRAGKMPRSFAGELARKVTALDARAGEAAVEVQALGLLGVQRVEVRCAGVGVRLEGTRLNPLPRTFVSAASLPEGSRALCLGAPWLVRFPGEEGRPYAGSFTRSTPPPYHPPEGAVVSSRALAARRGSELVFRTTRAQYTAGVLEAEDATLRGEARIALARVIAHNAKHDRHPGRPLCDTTHCQAFKGTVRIRDEERRALELPSLAPRGWLLFSRGGAERWTQRRSRTEVAAVLSGSIAQLSFSGGRAKGLRVSVEGPHRFEEPFSVPCEVLRGALKLPSCPSSAQLGAELVVFEGEGEGHGEGLDVEWAKRSGLPQDELLERAYGR